jgi:hypothetical protein
MSSRDFLSKRGTSSTGDTNWQPSELLKAAREGNTVILDGLDRLAPGCLEFLSVILVDGIAEGKRVKEGFRVIGTAIGSEWCTLGVLGMFSVVVVQEERINFERIVSDKRIAKLWKMARGTIFRISVRQGIRISRRIEMFESDLASEIRTACLYLFLPGEERVMLDQMLQDCGISTESKINDGIKVAFYINLTPLDRVGS